MFQFFVPRGPNNEPMQIPSAYRETTSWHPRIGDTFPKFAVATTQGDKKFWDWARGKWTYFFSQPAAYSSVCTAELVDFAQSHFSFRERGVQLMSLSSATVEQQDAWRQDISKRFNIKIDFPGAADKKLQLAKCFGMLHPRESEVMMIRKSFIIDPEMRIRSIVEYPINVARRSENALSLLSEIQDQRMSSDDFLQKRARPTYPSRIYSKRLNEQNPAER